MFCVAARPYPLTLEARTKMQFTFHTTGPHEIHRMTSETHARLLEVKIAGNCQVLLQWVEGDGKQKQRLYKTSENRLDQFVALEGLIVSASAKHMDYDWGGIREGTYENPIQGPNSLEYSLIFGN